VVGAFCLSIRHLPRGSGAAFGKMIPAFQKHCVPLTDFVKRIPQYAADFERLSGSDGRPKSIQAFLKARDYSISGDARVCRAVLAAFAAYMNDYHNCRVRPSGWFRRSLSISRGSYRGDFFDLFYRVMFEGLEIPEPLKDQQLIDNE
jgi:hypothetical protein